MKAAAIAASILALLLVCVLDSPVGNVVAWLVAAVIVFGPEIWLFWFLSRRFRFQVTRK